MSGRLWSGIPQRKSGDLIFPRIFSVGKWKAMVGTFRNLQGGCGPDAQPCQVPSPDFQFSGIDFDSSSLDY